MNLNLLNQVIRDSGIKKQVLAKKIGISANTLRAKTQDDGIGFWCREAKAIAEALHLDRDTRDKIFFDD